MWAFDMAKKVDPVTGVEIDVPLVASNSLLIIKPDPFVMAFHPRNEKKRDDIVNNWLQAEATDKWERDQFERAARLKREVEGFKDRAS